MHSKSIQRGNSYRVPGWWFLCPWLAWVWMLSVLMVSPGRGLAADSPNGPTPILRIVGPQAAKAVMEALTAEVGKDAGLVAMEYQRNDNPASAAGAMMAGREIMLSLGKLTDKDLGSSKDRWTALAAQEQAVGAQAIALVVHRRNPVDALSTEQLGAIFSGNAKDWRAFGGEDAAIRRYGLLPADPLTTLFHDKVIPSAKCSMIQRKKDSAEVLATLSSDPSAIAFVDAVVAAAAGGGVKIVSIGEGKSVVSPNAQTLKDGTYPLSQTLLMYVSPTASQAAHDVVQFIVSGRGDAICRQFGFMPTLRAVRSDATAAFEKLYGPDIKRVTATPDSADDLSLAVQIIKTARTTKLDNDLLTAMCDAAYGLAANIVGGETEAFEALRVLSDKAPDKRFDAALKRAALCERTYKANKAPADGEYMIEALMTAAELGVPARRFVEAANAWKTAASVAEEINSPALETLKDRVPAFAARVESLQEATALSAKLRVEPQNAEARRTMLMLQLVNLDDPAAAARYLDVAPSEDIKTNVPLAGEPMENLAEEAALKLAEWYVGLVNQADVGGQELMSARARLYYTRFFGLHKDPDDELAMRAVLGIQKVGGTVPEPPAPVAQPQPDTKNKPQHPKPIVNAAPKVGQRMTNLRLAEFVAANPDIVQLRRDKIGDATLLTDLSPLARLTKLTILELHQTGRIKDLSPLATLRNLTTLTLIGLEVDNISSLSDLSKLTVLNISGAKNVSDLSPIGRFTKLQSLNLSRCQKVSDLTPLSRLAALTALNLADCKDLTDFSPLESLADHLKSLNLSGTQIQNVSTLAKLIQLKTLDLQRCTQITTDDIEWLRVQLPECKVLLGKVPDNTPAHAGSGQ